MNSVLRCLAMVGILLIVSMSPVRSDIFDYCEGCFWVDDYTECRFGVSGYLYCVPINNSCVVMVPCGVCNGGCFLPGTLVETEKGLKAIEELSVGDRVLGLDGSDRIALCDVEKTYKSLQYSYYVINGKLRVTGTHPFWVDGKWVEASHIKVGDWLKGKGQELILVETIEVVNKGVRAYNIEVADANTFYVEGVLVHNKGPYPDLP